MFNFFESLSAEREQLPLVSSDLHETLRAVSVGAYLEVNR